MTRSGGCRRVAALGFASLLAAVARAATNGNEGVSPRAHDAYLRRGATDDFVMTIDLASAPPTSEPLDILLLFDATASMGDILHEVSASAATILRALESVTSDARFAVASFSDYGERGGPWRLMSDFSASAEQAVDALARIRLANGIDQPEAYSRGLFEALTLAWRPEARRYLILFGDAPAHDPTFYGVDQGIDPGRDGVPGTTDDLRLTAVADALAAAGIAVLCLQDTSEPNHELTARGMSYLAERTQGVHLPLTSAAQVPEAIRLAVREAYRPVPVVTYPPDQAAWVSLGPVVPVGDGSRFRVRVELRRPERARSGVRRFPLVASHAPELGAGEVGRTVVTIRTGLAYYPWRPVAVPAYILFALACFLVPWLRGRSVTTALPAYRSGAWTRLGLRLLAMTMLVGGLCLVWRFAPGTLPPP